jgi:acyl-coenzyme A thioesterase PaaI-like protein
MMSPQDANLAGNVHGGVVVKIIDRSAVVVAAHHARSIVVTASIDRMDFRHLIFVGDLLFFKASLNLVGRTSRRRQFPNQEESFRNMRFTLAIMQIYAIREQFFSPIGTLAAPHGPGHSAY